jgi:hypothetical protein
MDRYLKSRRFVRTDWRTNNMNTYRYLQVMRASLGSYGCFHDRRYSGKLMSFHAAWEKKQEGGLSREAKTTKALAKGGTRQRRHPAKAAPGKGGTRQRRHSAKAALGKGGTRQRRHSAKAALGKGGTRQRPNAYELLWQVHTASRLFFLIIASEKGLLNHGLCFI